MKNENEKIKERKKILQTAFDAREQEIMLYQINIDNYTLALNEISKLANEDQQLLQHFAEQLCGLLASEKLEQKKAMIMLSVIKQQLTP